MAVVLLCAGFGFSACTSDEGLNNPTEAGHGQLTLNLLSGTSFKEETRALDEASFSNTDNYTVVVKDKDGYVKMDCKGSEIASKMPITLPIGSCTVKAYYGTEAPASRNSFYVLGEWNGSIKGDQRESITLTCEPTCGRIKVDFDADMTTYYSDYNVTFSGTKALGNGTFAWSKNDNDPWYVALDKGGEDITISHDTRNSYVKIGSYELTARLIEGKYPNYNAVIPVNYNDYVEFDRKEMISVARRVGVFTNTASQLLKVAVSGMEMNVSGEDMDFSTKAQATLMVSKFGEDLTIGLKSTIMQTILNAFSCERISLQYMDASRAVIYRPAEPEEGWSQLILQMPMMLNN